ncbi:MtnX-like HAD-IB family phosphatase [Halobacillus litoralis]|uniref:MtnX-like HAD-IB family phosphatase n=1 Tax=Halobacillus litoralis TaxID=45668 RepID=UPI001CFEADA7|nr:MtnX-like HAD-IB family phosphatase [Halobacillus litoralis]
MKKWAFVSDFDGTISKKDFYWVVIEKYYPEGKELFKTWKAGDIKDIDFLSHIFTHIEQPEEQIIEDIKNIPIDESAPIFLKKIQEKGAEVYILSAGTDYYIHHILNQYEINNVTVLSNNGYFENKNIHLNMNPEHRHYSNRYGIDKAKVIQELKGKYETVHFAGDSEPDSHPAVYADLTFAKDSLQDLLNERNIPYIPVDTFKDIQKYLESKGWMAHD